MSGLRWMVGGIVVGLAAGGIGVVSAATSGGGSPAYAAIEPCRLADTRPAPDNVGRRATPLGPGEPVVFDVHGTNGDCTLPAAATAITANVTIVGPTAASFLSVWPSDGTNPGTSVLNWVAGQPPTPNAVTVAGSPDGRLKAFNAFGEVDLVIDVTGYFAAAAHDHDDRYYTKDEVDAKVTAAPSVDTYSKAQLDTKLAGKVDAGATYSKGQVDSKLGGKADAANTYTKGEVHTALDAKADVGDSYPKADSYSKGEVDSALATKAGVGDSYLKAEVDAALAAKADAADTYSKGEVDSALGGKADVGDSYLKGEVDAALGGKADVGDSYLKAEVDLALGGKADVGASYSKAESDAALAGKADASGTYTKAEVDGLVPSATYTVATSFTCDSGGVLTSCVGGSYTVPTAECSAGDLVTGGSARRTPALSVESTSHVSFPAGGATPTGWTTDGALTIGDDVVITVYAICLDITP